MRQGRPTGPGGEAGLGDGLVSDKEVLAACGGHVGGSSREGGWNF